MKKKNMTKFDTLSMRLKAISKKRLITKSQKLEKSKKEINAFYRKKNRKREGINKSDLIERKYYLEHKNDFADKHVYTITTSIVAGFLASVFYSALFQESSKEKGAIFYIIYFIVVIGIVACVFIFSGLFEEFSKKDNMQEYLREYEINLIKEKLEE